MPEKQEFPRPSKCSNNTPLEKDMTKEKEFVSANWDSYTKIYNGISDQKAFDFVMSQPTILQAFNNYHTGSELTFEAIDLGGDSKPEIVVDINGNESFIFQRSLTSRKHESIWYMLHDESTCLQILENKLIQITHFFPCSSCSITQDILYKVYQDSVKPVFGIYTSHEFDEDYSKNDFTITKSCHAQYCFVDSTINVTYTPALLESKTRKVFYQDVVTVKYDWDKASQQYLPGKAHCSDRTIVSFYFNDDFMVYNAALFDGWLTLRKNELRDLDKHSDYSSLIKKLEAGYDESWEELIVSPSH